MFSLFLRQKIGFKLGASFALLGVLSIINFFLITYFKSLENADTQVVNVAGRQRMLSQQIAFFSEMIFDGKLEYKASLSEAIAIGDQSLASLKDGGQAPGFPVVLPPTSDNIMPIISRVESNWIPYKENAKTLLSQFDNRESLIYLESASQHMLADFNELVGAYVAENGRKQRRLTTILISLLIGNIVFILMFVYFSIQFISRPIEKINSHIHRLSRGILRNTIAYTGTDELGRAAHQLKSLDENLSKAADFAVEINRGNLHSDFRKLSESDAMGIALIEMRESLRHVMNQTHQVVALARDKGQLDARVNEEGKEGVWLELSQSINQLLTSLSIPLQSIGNASKSLAKGDLSKRISLEAKGEVRSLVENFNDAMRDLSSLLIKVMQTVEQIDISSRELSSTSNEMNVSTNEISMAIAEMSNGAQNQLTKIDSISQMYEDLQRSSQLMDQRSNTIISAAEKGVVDSEKGAAAMLSIQRNITDLLKHSEDADQSMATLTSRSKEIATILNLITDIATQTNLLSLNAAIEAAQAGDAGKGFAVVAKEIRSLAESSRKAVDEISELVSGVQQDTLEAAETIKRMNTQVNDGMQASKMASQVFEEITTSSKQILDYSEEILKSTQNQSNSIQDVVRSSEGIIVVAEETAAGSEQVATSSAELASGMENFSDQSKVLLDIARVLREKVNEFQLKDEV